MAEHSLATYLNDHLAGSQSALELLEHLEQARPDTPEGRFASGLRAEVLADRRMLEGIMESLHVDKSQTKAAMTWLAGKGTELKLMLDDPKAGALRLLEVFDAVSMGIEGKRLLWRALATAAADRPDLRGPDYDQLEQRAEDQRRRVEQERLAAAKAALAGSSR